MCIGLADPYVKLYLLYDGQRVLKKKTHVKKRNLNPVFNESFIFDFPAASTNLEKVSLSLVLLDWDRVTKNEVGLQQPQKTLLLSFFLFL